ncbi:MAG TPA: hypothetical protein PLY36_13565 [Spirochaetota bacterium]|nr:hypothetical protein [Spirochaetota bacterium]
MKFSRLFIVSLIIILALSVSVFYNHAEPGYGNGDSACLDGAAGMGTYEACLNECKAYAPLFKDGTLQIRYGAPTGFQPGKCECCGVYKDQD